MKRLSVILFTVTFFLLLSSIFAPVAGFEITRAGAFLNGGLFAIAGLFAGVTHFKSNLRWVLKPLVISALFSVILGVLTVVGITASGTLSLLASGLTVGWGLFSLFSNW